MIHLASEQGDILRDCMALLRAAAADDDEGARAVAGNLADPALTAITLAQGYVALCQRSGMPPGRLPGGERDTWHQMTLFMGDPSRWDIRRIGDD